MASARRLIAPVLPAMGKLRLINCQCLHWRQERIPLAPRTVRIVYFNGISYAAALTPPLGPRSLYARLAETLLLF